MTKTMKIRFSVPLFALLFVAAATHAGEAQEPVADDNRYRIGITEVLESANSADPKIRRNAIGVDLARLDGEAADVLRVLLLAKEDQMHLQQSLARQLRRSGCWSSAIGIFQQQTSRAELRTRFSRAQDRLMESTVSTATTAIPEPGVFRQPAAYSGPLHSITVEDLSNNRKRREIYRALAANPERWTEQTLRLFHGIEPTGFEAIELEHEIIRMILASNRTEATFPRPDVSLAEAATQLRDKRITFLDSPFPDVIDVPPAIDNATSPPPLVVNPLGALHEALAAFWTSELPGTSVTLHHDRYRAIHDVRTERVADHFRPGRTRVRIVGVKATGVYLLVRAREPIVGYYTSPTPDSWGNATGSPEDHPCRTRTYWNPLLRRTYQARIEHGEDFDQSLLAGIEALCDRTLLAASGPVIVGDPVAEYAIVRRNMAPGEILESDAGRLEGIWQRREDFNSDGISDVALSDSNAPICIAEGHGLEPLFVREWRIYLGRADGDHEFVSTIGLPPRFLVGPAKIGSSIICFRQDHRRCWRHVCLRFTRDGSEVLLDENGELPRADSN